MVLFSDYGPIFWWRGSYFSGSYRAILIFMAATDGYREIRFSTETEQDIQNIEWLMRKTLKAEDIFEEYGQTVFPVEPLSKNQILIYVKE